MLVELLRPAGPELARRWLSALLLVPIEEREAVVREIEQHLVRLYAQPDVAPANGTPQVVVVSPPVQRDGYLEQTRTTYAAATDKKPAPRSESQRGRAS